MHGKKMNKSCSEGNDKTNSKRVNMGRSKIIWTKIKIISSSKTRQDYTENYEAANY